MFKKISEKTVLLKLAILAGMLFFYLIVSLLWIISPDKDNTVNEMLLYGIVGFISGYLSILLLFFVLDLQSRKNVISVKLFPFLFIPFCYLIALLWIVLLSSTISIVLGEEVTFTTKYFLKALNFLSFVVAFAGLYYLVSHWLSLKKQKEMTLMATNLANEAQLQMLRYQINPHFLFNALNTIRLMVEEDTTIARNMITELSGFFRYSLSQNGNTDTFENEIKAIKSYLSIQKIRFEEKLEVVYDIDEKVNQLKIPFFIILPLVENAIKFGLQSSKTALKLKICARIGEDLEISVHNTGKLIEAAENQEGTSTGISNTRKRLDLYYQDNYTFSLFEKDSWVVAQIIIKNYKNQRLN